jgi:hypothetical protein
MLSEKLYTALNAGTPPDVALRDAKLSLIHSQSVFRKPFYRGLPALRRLIIELPPYFIAP